MIGVRFRSAAQWILEVDATLGEAYDAVIDVLSQLYPASRKCQTSVIMACFQQQLYEIMTSYGKVMIRVTPFFAILNRTGFRWLILCGLLLALVFIPFVLMAESISIWTDAFASDVLYPRLSRMAEGQDRSGQAACGDAVTALVLGALLASDVLLPIPSSLLSTAAGGLYGFWPGALLSVYSNLGISLVYAAIGAHAVHLNSFMWALAGAILVPAIVILIWSNTKQYLHIID